MRARLRLALLCGALLLVGRAQEEGSTEGTEDDESGEGGDYYEADAEFTREAVEEGHTGRDSETGPTVYVMEHGFLSGEAPSWQPRGTLMLSGGEGTGRRSSGFEARLSDAKEFVQLKPELPQMMAKAKDESSYYAIRMYSPKTPNRILQAAIPASLLADHFEDWHDILEVAIGSKGLPIGLSYRVRHTLGLALFDHTQVHVAEASKADGPKTQPRVGEVGPDGKPGAPGAQPEVQSFLRKYWWVLLIVVLLVSSAGGEDPAAAKGGAPAAKGGGGGGGGGGAGGRRAT